MRSFFIVSFLLFCSTAWSSISGTVNISTQLKKKIRPGGSLFVILRTANKKGGPPVAILQLDSPKFPINFSVSKKDILIPGTQFKGPFTIKARYSPHGDPLPHKGNMENKNVLKDIKNGKKNIDITINKLL